MKITAHSTVRSVTGFAKASFFVAAMAVSALASAQYQKGPDPTVSALERTGSFATRTTTVSRTSASGFGGGTIYYPTASGTYGAIAISPGFTAYQSSISWMGTRLASHGFVVITIDTITTSDQPDSRGRQLKAALDKVVSLSRTSSSPIYNKVDASRLAVAGHSMGGGGTLAAARDNPSLKAAVPLAPWHTTKTWSRNTVPTLIIGGSADTVAGVATHSIPFYTSLPSSTDKAYMELSGASHFFPQVSSYYPLVGRYMISWFKRFVDDDTRYSPFLCGAQHQADLGLFSDISDYRENCPY
ncbi:MAG TPA: dienelactone hydrolase family protein [Rhizobacter sp.]|nr:dienelactone hydrolase family protein [Rhizobacter sp.]